MDKSQTFSFMQIQNINGLNLSNVSHFNSEPKCPGNSKLQTRLKQRIGTFADLRDNGHEDGDQQFAVWIRPAVGWQAQLDGHRA